MTFGVVSRTEGFLGSPNPFCRLCRLHSVPFALLIAYRMMRWHHHVRIAG